jgi:hypothetical protein
METNKKISLDELLSNASPEERFSIATSLSSQAITFQDLAWYLNQPREMLQEYVKNLKTEGRVRDALDRLREAIVVSCDNGNFASALHDLEILYQVSYQARVPPNDFLCLYSLNKNLNPQIFPQRKISQKNKLKIAYVFWGDGDGYCPLPKLFLQIAKFHRQDTFEISFVTQRSKDSYSGSIAESVLSFSKDYSIPLFYNKKARGDHFERAFGLAQAIVETNCDIVVYCTS